MKKIIYLGTLLCCFLKINAQEIRLLNPHPHDSGVFLHNGAFGSVFNNLVSTPAKIDFVKAQNLIASYKLTTTPRLIVDINNFADGNPFSGGITYNNSLQFGLYSGEGITSKRNVGLGRYGLDFYTNFKNRIHVGNDGSIGVGTTNGSSPTIANFGRFNIHNYNSGENSFYKDINLYTSANYDGKSDRTGFVNHIWNAVSGNPVTVNNFWNDMSWLYGTPTITPKNTIGIENNMRNITADNLNNNPSTYNYTYGIVNDLNDKKIAGNVVCLPGQPCFGVFQPRVGILNVTNTEPGSVILPNSPNPVSFGSGKLALWNVNIGGYSGGIRRVFDGWAQWNDGQTFLRFSPVISSDEKLKQNIQSIDKQETLKKIMALNPVSYEYKQREGITENGFLANDLQKVFPETVLNVINPISKEVLLGVQYTQLQSISIAAIQAQQEIITKLENKINELEKRISKISSEKNK